MTPNHYVIDIILVEPAENATRRISLRSCDFNSSFIPVSNSPCHLKDVVSLILDLLIFSDCVVEVIRSNDQR